MYPDLSIHVGRDVTRCGVTGDSISCEATLSVVTGSGVMSVRSLEVAAPVVVRRGVQDRGCGLTYRSCLMYKTCNNILNYKVMNIAKKLISHDLQIILY